MTADKADKTELSTDPEGADAMIVNAGEEAEIEGVESVEFLHSEEEIDRACDAYLEDVMLPIEQEQSPIGMEARGTPGTGATEEKEEEEGIVEVKIVGAGGLLDHCLPSLCTVLNGYTPPGTKVRGDILDPDEVEPRNVTRQWGMVGASKAALASDLMFDYFLVGDRNMLGGRARASLKNMGSWPRGTTMLVVLCLPDNHLTRMQVHKELERVGREGECGDGEVWGLYAGNGGRSGWCYVCQYLKGGIRWDWVSAHPDILPEMLAEIAPAAPPVEGCGRAPEEVGMEGQTLRSNQLTGVLIVQGLMDLLVWHEGSERHWYEEGEGKATGKILMYQRQLPDTVTTGEDLKKYLDQVPALT